MELADINFRFDGIFLIAVNGGRCIKDEDCFTVENSYCNTKKSGGADCECKSNFVLSPDKATCLPGRF